MVRNLQDSTVKHPVFRTITMETSFGINKTKDIANYMKDIANYMKAILRSEIRGREEWVPKPNLSMDLVQDCQYVVRIMVQAWRNQSK